MSKRILVTGGAGYIGSHACKALHRAGYTPVSVDNLVYGNRQAVQWGPLIQADLGDEAALEACFSEYKPTAVMHFAAFAYVGESVREPGKYYANNVAGTLGLLDAMRRHGCDKLIFSSTCTVYGNPEYLPLDEKHPLNPVSPYGRSKRFIEQILDDYDAAYGLKSISLRYFNAAGADPDGELGEEHSPETHLIPLALKAALNHDAPLTVFGNDLDTPDGTCIRDYVHVTDLAQAHMLALEYLDRNGSDAFNLGNGAGYSVQDVIKAVEAVTGHSVPCESGSRRPGDPAALVADSSRARAELGWNPQYGDLETIVAHAWAWLQRMQEAA